MVYTTFRFISDNRVYAIFKKDEHLIIYNINYHGGCEIYIIA